MRGIYMNIKISALKSRLKHSEQFDSEISLFLSAVENKLQSKLTFSELSDYDCDLKLIFVETGGSEGVFLKNFDKLKEPYYLLTNGSNNSLAASMEIMTYLRKTGKNGEILHGSADYIAKRIKQLAAVSVTLEKLKQTRLGVIGNPSDWLISSVPDYAEVKNKLGVTLIDIPLDEVKQLIDLTRTPDLSRYPLFNKYELARADAICYALQKIVEKYNLDGFTIRCFDLLDSIKSTGCLALAEFNRQGITATCEGDITAMLSMHIVKLLTGQSSFQANPSRIDVEKNEIVFAHCTVPFDMVESYKFDTHFESGIGVAIKGEMKTGQATIFRLSSDLKRYFVSSGEITKNLNESNLCRTQLVIKPDKPVTDILTNPCGNHHVIVYGDHSDKLTQLMNVLLSI